MKKLLCIVFAALLVLSCAACTANTETLYAEEITDELLQAEQKSVWGITLTAKDVTPKGLTVVCTQSGGEPTGELSTGSFYTVQRMEDGAWKTVEYTAVDPDMVAWTTEGWLIPPESTLEWEVDWTWLYNELPAGEYRIGKSVMDWRAPGDYDEVMLYAEFTVE